MKIISGSSNKQLAEKIAHALKLPLTPVEIFVFPDGERRIRIEDDVLDEDVVIIQSTSSPVDSHYMELFFLVDSANRNGARTVTVVIPYLGYQRQDHIFRSGEAVSFQVVVRTLETLGVDDIISFDLHTVKIPEFFHAPFTELSALPMFAQEIINNNWNTQESFLVSADMGGLRRIHKMSELLDNMPFLATIKDRDLGTGTIKMNRIDGDEKIIKKRALIIDDMISSGNTIVRSAKMMKDKGVEEIYVFVTHAIFSEEAPLLLEESVIDKIFVTDSVFIPEKKRINKVTILPLAPLIAYSLNHQ
jgi:ribose-phosphate pyrophosphokinase